MIFIVRIVFIPSKQKANLNHINKYVCESNYFCNVMMLSEENIIIKFTQYQKSNKASSIIYTNLECLILKNDSQHKSVNIFYQLFQCLQIII